MKVIVAGSRSITDSQLIFNILDNTPLDITELVCGMANGVDLIARDWAISKNIPIKEFPAYWDLDGRLAAGHMRNERMSKYSEALLLIWDGCSTGSKDMLIRARKRNLIIDLYDQSQLRLF